MALSAGELENALGELARATDAPSIAATTTDALTRDNFAKMTPARIKSAMGRPAPAAIFNAKAAVALKEAVPEDAR